MDIECEEEEEEAAATVDDEFREDFFSLHLYMAAIVISSDVTL